MKHRKLLAGVIIVLAALIALLFVYPHQMIAPGALIPAHSQLQQDCFACHAPLRGVSSARCIACHVPAEIGIRTTKGLPVSNHSQTTAFHADLKESNCTACHSDHAAVLLTQSNAKPFNHGLLKPSTAAQCTSCHAKPKDGLHDTIISGCAQCHTTRAWTPANFAHEKYFRLDSDHNVACTTCHKGNEFKTVTCYGCHEHQQTQIIAEHAEEGIRNIDNCARCHRSSSGEGGEHGGEEREGGERDDD